MRNNHRQGGKFGGNHTTLIDLAVVMVDIAAKLSEVKTISPGKIDVCPDKSSGQSKVKFAWMKGGLLMTIRQNRSIQEVRVFSANTQETMVSLARAARDRNISICFLKKDRTQTY